MKKYILTFALIASLTSCNESTPAANSNSNNQNSAQASVQTPPSNNVPSNETQKAAEIPNLTWEQLYPILKKNLMETTCEPCKVSEETYNSLTVNSRESDFMLSNWSFDKNTLKIADINGDGLVDYTIEMLDEGAGCGGNLGFYERWTLFGSNPTVFINTHVTTVESDNKTWVNLDRDTK